MVMEERRMRTESQPTGKLLEEAMHAAYKAHPYGEPVVGHMSDLLEITRPDAEAFFKKYYGPANLVSVIVGDVDPKKMRDLAETYFGRIPGGPKPEPLAHRGAAAGGRASRHAAAAGRAPGADGLSQAGHAASRQCRLPRPERRAQRRPLVAAVHQPGARSEDRRAGLRLPRPARQEVSRPVHVRRRHRARPRELPKPKRRSTPRSSGSRKSRSPPRNWRASNAARAPA